jgi:plastocyanin
MDFSRSFFRSRAGAASLSLVLGAALLVGCGGGGAGSTTSTAASTSSRAANSTKTRSVTITEFMFKPQRIIVAPGTTVTFTNHDSTAHTATSKQSGAFETGPIQPGKSASITMNEAGTFAYYCVFHPFMKGTIVVE